MSMETVWWLGSRAPIEVRRQREDLPRRSLFAVHVLARGCAGTLGKTIGVEANR